MVSDDIISLNNEILFCRGTQILLGRRRKDKPSSGYGDKIQS